MLKPRRELWNDRGGAAFLEFAIGFPVILLLIMGGLEITNLAVINVKLNHVAETSADNAARVRTQIDESNIDEILAGGVLVGQSINFDNKGRVVLSSIQDNDLSGSSRGQMIRWQRCIGKYKVAPRYGAEGRGRSDGSMSKGMGPPGRQIAAVPGTAVMFAEVTYRYDPVIFNNFISSRDIRYESAFNVRERSEFGITNVRGKPVRSC